MIIKFGSRIRVSPKRNEQNCYDRFFQDVNPKKDLLPTPLLIQKSINCKKRYRTCTSERRMRGAWITKSISWICNGNRRRNKMNHHPSWWHQHQQPLLHKTVLVHKSAQKLSTNTIRWTGTVLLASILRLACPGLSARKFVLGDLRLLPMVYVQDSCNVISLFCHKAK